MPVYNFKKIAPVPTADAFIDIVLTRTQRRTPTVIHPGYKIQRIRAFYMRKVKFTQQTTSERLGALIADFPRLDDIHPFYADLTNVLYDRDHFKVRKHMSRLPALDPNTRTLLVCGFPNVGKSSFMNKVTRANVDVQPYAFTTKSLYVGHMDYRYLRWQVIDTPGILDHELDKRNAIEMQSITALAHLPCCVLFFVDISEHCGYPIAQQLALFRQIKPLFAGKQLVLVANKVDVVTLAQLEATKPDEAAALRSLASEAGVSLIAMSNVTDEGVNEVKTAACDLLLQARVDSRLASPRKVEAVANRLTVAVPKIAAGAPARGVCIPASVLAARAEKARVAALASSSSGALDDDGMTVEDLEGGAAASAAAVGYAPTNKAGKGSAAAAGARKTQREMMWEGGGPGVYSPDYSNEFDLADESWNHDVMPEIMDGKNVADFIDADVLAKLDALEAEHDQIEGELAAAGADAADEGLALDADEAALLRAVRERKEILKQRARLERSKHRAVLPAKARARARNASEIAERLGAVGVPTAAIEARGRKRERSLGPRGGDADADMDDDGASAAGSASRMDDGADESPPKRGRALKRDGDGAAGGDFDDPRSKSRSRSQSIAAARARAVASKMARAEGSATPELRAEAKKQMRIQQKKRNKLARAGDADRHTGPKLLKHRLAGKSGLGTKTNGR